MFCDSVSLSHHVMWWRRWLWWWGVKRGARRTADEYPANFVVVLKQAVSVSEHSTVQLIVQILVHGSAKALS